MAVVTTAHASDGFVRADLEAMPDDGRRYELIDGSIIVTPALSIRHQFVLGELYQRVTAACPAGLHVFFAPLDVALDESSVLQPDLLVAPLREFTEQDLPRAPLLAVEVLSPTTRRIDLTLKRSRYEAAGTPSYWVIDPAGPSVTVWELEDGAYVEQAHVTGADEVTLERPFPITLRPADLVPPAPQH